MNLDEVRNRLIQFDLSEIKPTWHGFNRMQDKRRSINYPQIVSLLISQKGFYRFEEQKAINEGELKFKLWFKLNYLYDMNVYVVMNKTPLEKGLNRLMIISAHKVKRKIQENIDKNEN